MEERIRKLTVKDCEEFEKTEKKRLGIKKFNADFKNHKIPENYVRIAEYREFDENSKIDITDESDRSYVMFFKYPYIYVDKNDIEYDSDRIRFLISEAFYPAKLIK